MDAPPVEEFTAAQWKAFVQRYRKQREEVHQMLPADFLLRFHGGRQEALEAFREVPALPLTPFAECMGVRATTVRYYTRLGLLPHMRLGRRNLYPSFACMSLARTMHFRKLGMGIGEIQERMAQERRLSQEHLGAMERAGTQPLGPENDLTAFQAALEMPEAAAARDRMLADQEAFAKNMQARLEAQRDEAEARLTEFRKFRPEREE